jgi:hypothetical protein
MHSVPNSQTPKWILHLSNRLFDRALIVVPPAGSGEPVTCPVQIGALPRSVEQLNTIKVSASSEMWLVMPHIRLPSSRFSRKMTVTESLSQDSVYASPSVERRPASRSPSCPEPAVRKT